MNPVYSLSQPVIMQCELSSMLPAYNIALLRVIQLPPKIPVVSCSLPQDLPKETAESANMKINWNFKSKLPRQWEGIK